MDKEVVDIMSTVCQKLSHARVNLSKILSPEDYSKFREIIFDCEQIMAAYCDCAPIRLIDGQVEDIMLNYETK
jgi:hypothetical protein